MTPPKSTSSPDPARGGIVLHFGVGNFHRAHQAWHLAKMNARAGCDWRILGVAPRRPNSRDLLRPRNWRYHLLIEDVRGAELTEMKIHSGILVAPENPEAVAAAVADPRAALITFTLTEEGYASPESLARPSGVFHLLAEGLDARRRAGRGGATIMSCDNLPDNGDALREKILAAAAPDLAEWIARECAFPATMVDRIVPKTDDALRERLRNEFGIDDPAPVRTERFSQWMVENKFADSPPPLEAGGARIVEDIRPPQAAKLAMLNGAHSLLACAGLLRGMEFVHEAAAHPELAAQTNALWDEASEIAPSPPDYRLRLSERFRNAALAHRLEQIAADSSRKIPARWMPILRARAAAGLPSPALESAVATWAALTINQTARGLTPDDPLAKKLTSAARSGPAPLLALNDVFGDFFTAQPELAKRVAQKTLQLSEALK